MTDNEAKTSPFKECSFCKSPRDTRAMMFSNPAQDFAICDVCVLALYPFVRNAYVANGNPYERPEGKPS